MAGHRALQILLATSLAIAASSADAADAADKKACATAYVSGQDLRDHGRFLEARRQLAVCLDDTCPEPLRRDCIEWLKDLEHRVPSVVVRARDRAGHDLVRADVAIDGGARRPIDGRPIELDPGPHAFEVSADGAAVRQELVVAEGEKARAVAVTVPLPVQNADRPGAPPSVRPNHRALWALAFAGAGALSLGGSAFFYVSGMNEGASLEERCGSPPSCARADTDAAHQKLVVGDVLAGAGLVLVGVATYLWLIHPTATRAYLPATSVTRVTF